MISCYECTFEPNATHLGYDLANFLLPYSHNPVFVCIGHSKVLSDCLGCVVGQLLTNKNIPYYVYGNLTHNISYDQFEKTLQFIAFHHFGSPIVLIDSGLGQPADVGRVVLTTQARVGAFSHSAAKVKNHISLLGMVNTQGINNLLFLKSVKLKTVLHMANFIAHSIEIAMEIVAQADKTDKQNKNQIEQSFPQ